MTHLNSTDDLAIRITNCMVPSVKPIGHSLGSEFARASLEGMPNEIRAEIMLRLPDLPTLRLLKLSSREYYFTARACERSLKAVHQAKPCRADAWSSRRQAQEGWPPRGDRRDDAWPTSLNEAFFTAAREWYTDIDPTGRVRFVWKMPGTRNFFFNKSDYIVSRIYRLTGEYPSIRSTVNKSPRTHQEYRHLARCYLNAVNRHTKDLKERFEEARTGLALFPRDRNYAERMNFLYNTDLVVWICRAAQDREFWRLFDESVAKRRQQDLVSLVIGAMDQKPQLAAQFVEILKKDGTLELQGDEWVLAPRPRFWSMENESDPAGLDHQDVRGDQVGIRYSRMVSSPSGDRPWWVTRAELVELDETMMR